MSRAAIAIPFGRGRVIALPRPRTSTLSRTVIAELTAKIMIITVFSSMAIRIARDARATGHVTGMLLVASEALVVALTIVRRRPVVVDRRFWARTLTGFSTFGSALVRPMSQSPIAPEPLTVIICSVGLIVVVLGKLSLGRSFGLAPANRGIVCRGLYQRLRHPIYLGYLITHVGFVLANPGRWNFTVLFLADVALMLRAMAEERTLSEDSSYRAYMDKVRWRIVPGVF